MTLHLFEATSTGGNWGKVAGRPDVEWRWRSAVSAVDIPHAQSGQD